MKSFAHDPLGATYYSFAIVAGVLLVRAISPTWRATNTAAPLAIGEGVQLEGRRHSRRLRQEQLGSRVVTSRPMARFGSAPDPR